MVALNNKGEEDYRMRKILMVLVAMAFVMGISSANALTVNYVDGVVQTTSGLTGYQTNDDDMYGMTISILWGNSSTNDYIWGDLGGGVSGISGGWGSIGFDGDSFTANWSLATDSRRMDSIFIDAGAGDAVFDVWDSSFGTDGSARGHAFSATYNGGFDITATYSGAVALNGDAPVGDLYRYLTIDFTGDYFRQDDSLTFRADTDSLAISGDIAPVPEPSTILLLGAGLLGLVGYNRKRFSKKS